jgi:MYXO-CTERM domain-containing protein
MSYPCTVNVSCAAASESDPWPFALAVLTILALCLIAAMLQHYYQTERTKK